MPAARTAVGVTELSTGNRYFLSKLVNTPMSQLAVEADGLAVIHVAVESLVPRLHLGVVVEAARSIDRLRKAEPM